MSTPTPKPLPPAELLPHLLATDPAAPRLTCYDDLEGPTRGERIELSARVLDKWVSKAANVLAEHDLGPGAFVRLAVAPHWRAVYWALATWTVGAAVALDDAVADLVVTDDAPVALAGGPAVLVTRASLARRAAVEVPWDVLDDAKDLATHPDAFTALEEPTPDDPALRSIDGAVFTHDSLPVPRSVAAGARVAAVPATTGELLDAVRASWSAGGSLVIAVGGEPGADLRDRWSTEAVTEIWR